MNGLANHIAGHAAEDVAARAYMARGAAVLERCWRCEAGEIDLIVREGETFVFVEVKRRANLDVAAQSISTDQWARIAQAAQIYMYEHVGPELRDMRFDAVLLDHHANTRIVENAAEY